MCKCGVTYLLEIFSAVLVQTTVYRDAFSNIAPIDIFRYKWRHSCKISQVSSCTNSQVWRQFCLFAAERSCCQRRWRRWRDTGVRSQQPRKLQGFHRRKEETSFGFRKCRFSGIWWEMPGVCEFLYLELVACLVAYGKWIVHPSFKKPS